MRSPVLSSSTRRERRALVGVLALGVLGASAATVPGSGAAFSASTKNPGNVLSAAADWVAPTVAVSDPGTPLRGTVAVTATASDAGSGIASVAAQYAPNAGAEGSYVTVCTSQSSPASCAWDTTKLADGLYKVRATATDKAQNAATSAVVSQRLVDNTAPTGTLTDPGTNLPAGQVQLSGTADDATSGVRQVVVQRAPTGTTTWTDVCTTAPTGTAWGCGWSATAGTYDLRAVVTDNAGNVLTTATVARRVVVADTVKPTAASVLALNGTGTAGTMEAGDTIVLRWSERMTLSTIMAGLSETADVPLVVQTNAGGILGSSNDTLSFTKSATGATPNLGTIDLGSGGWVTILSAAPSFQATARARTVGGATEVVITLGAKTGTQATSVTSPVRLGWTPSAAPTDLAGNGTATTTFTQSASTVAF